MDRQVQRKVYFFRAYCGLDAAGRPLPFDSDRALAVIQGLEFREGANYMDEGDGNVLCCWVDRHGPSGRACIARVRRTALPLVEQNGRLKPLDIPATSGLAESVYVVFFPENVVGFLYNHFGPRISRVAHYFRDRAVPAAANLRFDALLMPNILNQLDRIREVRTLSLRLRRSVAAQAPLLDESLGALLKGAAGLGDAERIEVILRPKPYSRNSLGGNTLDVVRRLARRDDIAQIADRFCLEAETDYGIEPINILSSYLVSEQKVVTIDQRTRGLDDASAYAAIELAYQQLENDIRQAAAVWVPHE